MTKILGEVVYIIFIPNSSEWLFMRTKYFMALALVLGVLALGCIGSGENSKPGDGTVAQNKFAVIETNKGTIKFELYEDKAPITAKNFIKLANSGFYNGLTFHRYVKDFVIQGGDPKGDGTGGSSETIPLEINKALTHVKGAVGMARSQDPNSASSQFYITLADVHDLDGNYAVFGKVTEGMDVVLQLRQRDRMTSVKIVGK